MANLRDELEYCVREFGRRKAFILKDENGEHHDITFEKNYNSIRCLGAEFIERGMAGQRIAVIGKNSYNWYLASAATQLTGGITVPIDKELRFGELEMTLVRSRATILFYDKKEEELVHEVVAAGKTSVEYMFPLYKNDEHVDIFDLLEDGRKKMELPGRKKIDEVEIDENAVSFLIFTSGTTSNSKIVMLSQRNIYANTYNTLSSEDIRHTDVNMALLPYHHIFGLAGQWLFYGAGCCTVYCDGLRHIQSNMKEYKVSIFFGVPLIIESMYKKIMKTAEKNNMTGKLNAARKVCHVLSLANININRVVFKGILDVFGGDLRLIIFGGAPADPEVVRGFADFGIVALQGYGLTETAPVVAAERPDKRRPGSIGVPINNVEVDIFEPDENGIGELRVKSAGVMKGYYEDEEATNAVLRDGWFYTGDLGYFDQDGFLFITGRKRNLIVLKNGKKVFAEELESLITALPYAPSNIVVGIPNEGDQRDPVVGAKIVYDPEDFPGMTPEEIDAKIRADIDAINETVPHYKRIRRVFVTDVPMEMTTTGKVKKYVELKKIIAEDMGVPLTGSDDPEEIKQ